MWSLFSWIRRKSPDDVDEGAPTRLIPRLPHLPLTTGSGEGAICGRYRSPFRGRGMDFADLREYLPGDEIRFIDWNATARTGKPHTKRFEAERGVSVLLAVDVSRSCRAGPLFREKREGMQEVSRLLALLAADNGDKVGLFAFSDRVERFIPPRRGRGHALRLLRELSALQPQGTGTDAAAALAHIDRSCLRRSVVFLLSDFHAPLPPPQLRTTALRHDLVAVRVVHPWEREMPDVGLLTAAPAEGGKGLLLDTSDPGAREAFRRGAEQARRLLARTLRSHGVDLLEIEAGTPPLPPIVRFLKSRAKGFRRRGGEA